jgi:ABC-type multidrug transport system fused ATPase/permease subunit
MRVSSEVDPAPGHGTHPHDTLSSLEPRIMRSLWRLRSFLRPYWRRILFAALCLMGITGISLIFPLIIRQVIDVGLAGADLRYIVYAALAILVLGLLRSILAYGQRYLTEWISHNISYDLRNRLYDHIQHLPFTFHDRTQSGQLISRTIEDVRAIERFTGSGLAELVRVGLLLIGIITLLLLDNPLLACIALLPMLPQMVITTRFGRRISRFFLSVENALGELSVRLQENVSGVQVVRAFSREPYEVQRFDKINRQLFSARLTVISEFAKIMPTSHFLIALATILILWFGGGMVMRGELTLGELVAFNSYMLLLAEPLQILGWLVNSAGEASAGVQRTMEILDKQPEIQTPSDAIQLPPLSGCVEFRDLSLRYAEEERFALQDINLVVEPNQIVALIGATGSGKTSLVNMIPRFYDATQGSVLVDGYDVRHTDLASLRRQTGIVLQSSLLFSTSIAENIAYGRTDAVEDEIIAAAKAAQAHEFILELPEQYQTVVGERGVTLSGGQRQRTAIARALLMDPRILILDDSTSSVDTHTEYLIQQALERLMQGRTTFVIAQRLSTIRRADVILVMDQGRIVERGTHASLIAQEGLYREIYELQFRDQERFQEEIDALETQLGRARS